MAADRENIMFGSWLRDARVRKGMSIEDVSKQIRVSKDTLVMIEHEDIAKFPAQVFMKGFLRSYAEAVGVDAETIVRNYLSQVADVQQSVAAEPEVQTRDKRFWRRLVGVAGIFICIIVLSVFFMSPSKETSLTSYKEHGEQTTPAEKEHPEAVLKTLEKEAGMRHNPAADARKWVLKVSAVNDTWITVIIDDQKPKEFNLRYGDSYTFEAASEFNVLVVKPDAVTMTLNDTPVDIKGNPDQVLKLTLP